jgi:beta-N-acetylhexosaminidase
MSVEQKVGQVFMVGLDPTSSGRPDSLTIGDPYTVLTAEVAGLLAGLHIGGVVYFERNVGSPAALAALSAALQENAQRHGDPGLVIAIDQEGGWVSRLREARGFTEFPSPMALGATGDPGNARRMAAAIAGELKGK